MHTAARRRSLVPIALAAALLTAFLVLLFPHSAAAHDSLVASSPEADSTVETLPAELTLTFSAQLIDGEGATEVVVTGPDGASAIDGAPTLDGAIVTQPLVDEAAAGEYHVIWKVVSSDGHPVSGEYSFVVTTGTAPEAPVTTPPTAAPSAEPTPTASETSVTGSEDPNMTAGSSISAPWLVAGAVVVLIAAFLSIVWFRRRRSGASSDSDAAAEG